MHATDRKKLTIAAVLFGIIAVTYLIEGKSLITKTIVAICGGLWLVTIYFLKPKKK